jgi:threonyl-tRNA synthetase
VQSAATPNRAGPLEVSEVGPRRKPTIGPVRNRRIDLRVVLDDGGSLELPEGSTGLDAVRMLGPRVRGDAVVIRTGDGIRDLRQPLQDGERIEILTVRDSHDPDALYVLRHSAAHLLAEAVRRLHPGVKVAIGPPVEDGFYYDFDFPEPITEAELAAIEAEIHNELRDGRVWNRIVVDRADARALFEQQGEPYKVELLEAAQGEISLYTQGDFTDLCRGPHLQDSKPIAALKLTSLAGAYWRGDERNAQLTRIYGTAFFREADLTAHLKRLEEARQRDHRRLGRELGLFDFSRLSPGSPFWHPKGMTIWNELEDLRRRENYRRGYVEVRTPELYDAELWKTSGHWSKFRQDMITLKLESRSFGVKPMNCPGHCILFSQTPHSYRDLPVRYAEAGNLHRNERSGVLHGLLRVRHFVQDDAHIFCAYDQIQSELVAALEYAFFIYDRFHLEMKVELSTRPEKKLGTKREWDRAESELTTALAHQKVDYSVSAGQGSFYGPKIDLHMLDSLGRSWQLGTVQLDLQMPKRFGLSYVGSDNRRHTPAMIHRALLGSFERFVGILLEHTNGDLPLWLAPIQVRLIPVAERHVEAVQRIEVSLRAHGVRVDADTRDETLGRRIRDAETGRVPYAIIFGDRESESALAIRLRGGEQLTLSCEELLNRVENDLKER